MPRLAALGLVQQQEGQEEKAEQEEESHTPSSLHHEQQQHRKKRPRGGQGQWEGHQWARRLWAAGVETAEELLVMEPEFARTLLSSSSREEEESPASPPPKQRVRRKEVERLQAAVAARIAPAPFLLHHARPNYDATNAGQNKDSKKRGRPSSSASSSSLVTASFPLPRLAAAVPTTAWDEWRHVQPAAGKALPSGCRNIDRLLAGGGFPLHALCEVMGPSAAGKTQLCLSLAAEAALTLESGVVYVDSNGSFCPRRLRAILLDKAIHRQQEQQQHPPPGQPADNALADAALGRVQCLRAADDAALLSALDCLGQRLQGRAHPTLRLLVLDSVRGPLAPLLGQSVPNGHYMMGSVGKALNYLALRFGLCVVAVNGVVADRHYEGGGGGRASSFGGAAGGGGAVPAMWGFRPALGTYWSTFPSLRLLLRPCPASSSSSSSSSSHSLSGPWDEPLLCEAAVYSAARQDTVPPTPTAAAGDGGGGGNKRAFFLVTGGGVVDPPTRRPPAPTPAHARQAGGGSGSGGGAVAAAAGSGVVPPYQATTWGGSK